jgi:hypothetical protein
MRHKSLASAASNGYQQYNPAWLEAAKIESIVSKNGNECCTVHMQGKYECEMYYGLSPMLTRIVMSAGACPSNPDFWRC